MTEPDSNRWSKRIAFGLWSALPVTAMLFLFGPLLIYLPNSRMFSYMLPRVVAKFALPGAAAWLLAAVCLAMLPGRGRLRRQLAALTLAAAALLWLQAHVINWQYGVLDGRDIPWSGLAWRGWIDAAVWLAALLGAWRLADALARRLRAIALALLLLPALSLAVLLAQHPEALQAKNFMLFDESGRFRFSAERNAIVLITDGFQSDLFQELIDEDPSLARPLAGFTYFRNAVAGFPLTMPSVPFLLTGERYDNSLPFADFLRRAYRAPVSLLQALRRNGWRTDVMMEAGSSFDLDPALISNLRRGQVPLTNRQAGFLFDLGLFRHAPHFLKRVVYAGQRWRFARYLRDRRPAGSARLMAARNPLDGRPFSARELEELYDVRFLADLETGASASEPVPVFKFYHLDGVHPPLRMNERLAFASLRNSRRDWKRVGRGNLVILGACLDRLQRLGILREAVVFIVGDHGASLGQFGMRLPPGWAQTGGEVPETVRASGMPLVLAKLPGASGPLRTSDAPVSLGDVPATLLHALALPAPGESMFAIAETSPRTRRFSHFVWAPGDSGKAFLPPLTDYLVTGHSWLAASWRPATAGR